MLICNYSYINRICGHNHSGVTNPVWIIAPHTMRGYYGNAQVEDNIEQIKRDGFPTGTNPPYCYILGDKGALLSATTTLNGDTVVTAGLASGINIESDLDGSCSVTSSLSLVTSMNAALSGSGTLTASLVGTIALSATINGTSNVTSSLSLIANMIAELDGQGILTANATGILSMSATIYVNQSEATVQQIVNAMWNALVVDFNTAGTMGQALGAAGTAGDPWTTTLPGGYSGDQAGAMIDRMEEMIQKIKTLTLVNIK